MQRLFLAPLTVGLALLLAGCAAPLVIDARSLPKPKTVVINDFPDINPAAVIGMAVLRWPQRYFSPEFDGFFVLDVPHDGLGTIDYVGSSLRTVQNQIVSSPTPVSPGTAASMGLVGGLIGALLQDAAETTQKRAAAFPSLVRQQLAPADLRADFLGALRSALEARGIAVRISGDTRALPLRMHWPAMDPHGGKALPVGPLAATPAVDADLLVQVAPVAFYLAPGVLNAYRRKVGVAVAVFNGRTREPIGLQTFEFEPADGKHEYRTYDDLVDDIAHAAPALRTALLSLVPDIARTVAAENVVK